MSKEMSDYDKEIVRASTEIIKGIISNPNVKITYKDYDLFFQFDNDTKPIYLESIYSAVIAGVNKGMK